MQTLPFWIKPYDLLFFTFAGVRGGGDGTAS
jgi:hypothetical protein